MFQLIVMPPLDWDAIAEDVFDFDEPLFEEEIEEGQFVVLFFISWASFIQSVCDPSSFVRPDEVTHVFDLNLPAEEETEGDAQVNANHVTMEVPTEDANPGTTLCFSYPFQQMH